MPRTNEDTGIRYKNYTCKCMCNNWDGEGPPITITPIPIPVNPVPNEPVEENRPSGWRRKRRGDNNEDPSVPSVPNVPSVPSVPSVPNVPSVPSVPNNTGLNFQGLTNSQIQNILSLTSIFENSTKELQFSYCEDIKDGRGYTFSFCGFCSGTFDGSQMLQEYYNLSKNESVVPYLNAMKQIDARGGGSSTSGLENFPSFVKSVANTQEWKQASYNICNKLYVNPSQQKARSMGFTHALTLGQLYDSYINHGEDGAIKIINKVKNAVNELNWLAMFLNERYKVLSADKTWAESVDRVRVYQKLLTNPDLNPPFTVSCYGDTFQFS